jgi:Uma2 family endonuclease
MEGIMVVTSTQRPFTRADLERMPADAPGWRHEIIDGRLVVSPAPSLRHARVVAQFFLALEAWTREHGGETLGGNFELYIDERQTLIPDLLLMLAEHVGRFEERYLRQPPDVVVEVSSSADSRRRDLVAKRGIYGAFAVPEYWVVDLRNDVVLAFRLGDQDRGEGHADSVGYGAPTRYETGDTLSSPLLPGFHAPVSTLLAVSR